MLSTYTYHPAARERLLSDKDPNTTVGLVTSLADVIERECAGMISGTDRTEIQNFRTRGNMACVDGDEYFSRYHSGEHETDILLGVLEQDAPKILLADCKIQMKGGASITNLNSLPEFCANVAAKYASALKNIAPIAPVANMHIIFNHAVAAVARRVLDRCARGKHNPVCDRLKCFKFECLTIEAFRRMVVKGLKKRKES